MPLEHKKFYILTTLAASPMHGYGIQALIQRDSGLHVYVSYTSLYRVLEQLVKQRLITETEDEDRVYVITRLGRARLSALTRALSNGLHRHIGHLGIVGIMDKTTHIQNISPGFHGQAGCLLI